MHATRSLWMPALISFAILVFLHQHAVTSSYQYAGTHDPQPPHRRVAGDYVRGPGRQQQLPQGSIDDSGQFADEETTAPYSGSHGRSMAAASLSATVANKNNNQHVQPNRPTISLVDRNRHKCTKWVPVEMVSKYKWASVIQKDNLRSQVMIEVCCKGFGPMRRGGMTVCQPQCDNCTNGSCEAPDVCKCYEEFVRNDNGDCVFTCPVACLNGVCYLDGTCECADGYKLDESRKFCRPICSDGCGLYAGTNCTEPAVCGCSKGYRMEKDGCKATCHPPCGEGGHCRAPNKCECREGYKLKDGVCQADCYQNCIDGYCYTRNRCICKPGFTYHEGSSSCVPM